MALVFDQVVEDRYALYNGDHMEVLPGLPDESVGMSIYSPPFAKEGGSALYNYSSSDRDMSNARTYDEFFEQFSYLVTELHRVTMPGRITAVHCMDVPTGNTGKDELTDFPGDIIRLHRDRGFGYIARYHIWKEPLAVRNRTMTKSLAHKSVVDDSSRCSNAGADYLLVFRKRGSNPVPIEHPTGFTEYYGERLLPPDVLPFRGWSGNQIQNKFSHIIWQRYASAFWDDIRLDRVLPFEEAEEDKDEKHPHPLQRDVIDRCLVLWSNPGELVVDPCGGVGSVAYCAVRQGRRAISIELKPSYHRQAVMNMKRVDDTDGGEYAGPTLFDRIDG